MRHSGPRARPPPVQHSCHSCGGLDTSVSQNTRVNNPFTGLLRYRSLPEAQCWYPRSESENCVILALNCTTAAHILRSRIDLVKILASNCNLTATSTCFPSILNATLVMTVASSSDVTFASIPGRGGVSSAKDTNIQVERNIPDLLSRMGVNSKAPVSRLPNEILCLIFEAALREEPSKNLDYNRASFGMTVSQVMHSWRVVAVRLPSLWTCIDIRSTYHPDLIAEFLRRSVTRPLDLRIFDRTKRKRPLNIEPFLELIVLHLSRLRKLSLDLDNGKTLFKICERFHDTCAPSLGYLRMSYYALHPANASLPQMFSHGVPKLRFLNCKALGPQAFLPSLRALTTLRLYFTLQDWDNNLDYNEFREMLGTLSSLVELTFHGSPVLFFDDVTTDHPILMPSLKWLDLCAHRTYSHEGFLLLFMITAPSLYTLNMEGFYTVEIIQRLITGLSSRYPALDNLIWKHVLFSPAVYDAFMQAFPQIRHFTLIPLSHFIPLHLFSTPAPQQPFSLVRWPELLSFTIQSADTDPSSLCSMVSARASAGRPLKMLGLGSKVRGRVRPEQMEWLKAHVAVHMPAGLSEPMHDVSRRRVGR
ncbi:hypothetical protein PLICRDRAFT_501822 [Plicaturopsis crispa FD-325 SS-3]|nr:hypothetical protein PLICRDRAFT_501822 [Plicaturopsis crispa FD-325 SS-3]